MYDMADVLIIYLHGKVFTKELDSQAPKRKGVVRNLRFLYQHDSVYHD
ncbi:hypothetical protein [Pseudoalteromonas sp. B62]